MTGRWVDELDLDSLRLIVLVGELGSIGAAATQLGTTQPSASKRLAVLERRLQLNLVERTRRGSSLTATGRVVCDWAQRVLSEVESLHSGLEALRGEQAAELRVAASMTIAEHLAPGWIGQLRRTWPELHVGLQVVNSTAVVAAVGGGEAELGFVESPGAPQGLATQVVARDRLAVVVPPTHPWARRHAGVLLEELAATPLVVRESGSGTRETLDRALARAGVPTCEPLLELGSTTAVRTAVTSGVAPAVLSVLAVATDVADGRLVEVPVHDLDLHRLLRAVWPRTRQLLGPAADLLATATRASGTPATPDMTG